MALIHCRRRVWLRFRTWMIAASVTFLFIWNYQSWVFHGFDYVTSLEYRGCVARRTKLYQSQSGNGLKNQKLFVTLAQHGRLGNWMYQYASLIGIAKANGVTPYLDAFHPLTLNFKLTTLKYSSAECLLSVNDQKPLSYDKKLTRLPKANITLDGYFQSWKYFKGMEKEVRHEFSFKPDTEKIIRGRFDNYVGRHVKAGREVISIHVRRGDYTKAGSKRLGFKMAPILYFANAIRYMQKYHPYSVFLVVSDDMNWCRENILSLSYMLKYEIKQNSGISIDDFFDVDNIGNDNRQRISLDTLVRSGNIFISDKTRNHLSNADDVKSWKSGGSHYVNAPEWQIKKLITNARAQTNRAIFAYDSDYDNSRNNDKIINLGSPPFVLVPRDSSIIDLGLLSLANHSIVSTGTFGWWGAWLAGGTVVYYNDWLEEDHIVHSQWTKGDYYPSDWIPLSGANNLQKSIKVSVLSIIVISLVKFVNIFVFL